MFLLWLWYMMPWIGAVVMARLCWRASPYLSSIDAVHATGDDQDVDAAPAKRRKRDPKPTLPDLDPSQPNLHRWFPTREPGPAASPRTSCG